MCEDKGSQGGRGFWKLWIREAVCSAGGQGPHSAWGLALVQSTRKTHEVRDSGDRAQTVLVVKEREER